MYTVEREFSASELEIIFRIRQLIGDEKEVFVDDVNSNCTNRVLASGTMYQLEEPKGYPLEVYVNGIEYTTSGSITADVLGYKLIKFSNPVLFSGVNITVIYEHFRHSDSEILDTYDTSSMTYLTQQCNLSAEDLGIDLLVLATSYVLLMKDLHNYIKSAIRVQDSDSQFDGSTRPTVLKDLLKSISDELLASLKVKTSCKVMHLPVYKVE